MTDQQRPDQQDFTANSAPADADRIQPMNDNQQGAATQQSAGVDPYLTAQFGDQQHDAPSDAEGASASAYQPAAPAVNDGPREPIRVAPTGHAQTAPANETQNDERPTGDAAHTVAATTDAQHDAQPNAYGTEPETDRQASELDEALARSRAIPSDGDLHVPPADYGDHAQEQQHSAAAHESAQPQAQPAATTEYVHTEPAQHEAQAQPATAVPGYEQPGTSHAVQSSDDVDEVLRGEDRTSTEGLVMPPEQRSNRGFAVFTAILASIVFAAAFACGFAAAAIIFGGATGAFVDVLLGFIRTAAFFIPVALFTIVMVLWSMVANRAGWWSYIIASLIVALIAFFGYHLGVAAQDVVNGEAFSIDKFMESLTAPEQLPGALIAFIAARESALWIGGIASLRGRRVKRKNAQAQEEYEQKIAEEREFSQAV